MPSIHRDREPTHEPDPAAEVATPTTSGPEEELHIARPAPAAEQPSRRRSRGPKRPTATAHAGHASGSGEASGA